MSKLKQYLEIMAMPEVDAMNQLQDAGIVSDNCVHANDVSEADSHRAVNFLEGELF